MTNYNTAKLIYKYKCCSPKCLYEWKSEIADPGPKQCRLCKNTHWADPLWFEPGLIAPALVFKVSVIEWSNR